MRGIKRTVPLASAGVLRLPGHPPPHPPLPLRLLLPLPSS